jgi:thioredoxin-related protein
MKIRIIAILALSLMVGSSFKAEEGIKWLDFNKGYELAKKKNKIMIVDVYTEWCGWCKRMDKDAY